jgi:thiamine biosynthesis protein ThiI
MSNGYKILGKLILAALSGEIVLKSPRTRPRFEHRLLRNLSDAFQRNSLNDCRPYIREARIIVECSDESLLEKALEVMCRVFGVHAAAVAVAVQYRDLESLAAAVERVAADWVKGKLFAVRARRSGREPFTSLDVARIVGARLKPYSSGVNLENPEAEVYVEVRGSTAYVHKGMLKGPGGLPIGVEGRVLALFSGGLDSPVAVWYAARRGAEVDMLHLILANPASLSDAKRVATVLAKRWLYGYKPKLAYVDFRLVTSAIAEKVRRGYEQVVLRTAMYYAADLVGEREGYDAIVTGESIGQVSSQTLKNIKAIERVYKPRLPLLRPLAGMDKEEIVSRGREIGVYEEAAKTKEYCKLMRDYAVTRADPKILEEEFAKVKEYVEESVKTLKIIELG